MVGFKQGLKNTNITNQIDESKSIDYCNLCVTLREMNEVHDQGLLR
ncbi:MAG: hypothetical protein HW387_1356 [Parachlamydiales bacterium]|nr:hypothetical protein [Parachlamydiales bacterium]